MRNAPLTNQQVEHIGIATRAHAEAMRLSAAAYQQRETRDAALRELHDSGISHRRIMWLVGIPKGVSTHAITGRTRGQRADRSHSHTHTQSCGHRP